MNRFQKAGLAVILAAGMAFAQVLWRAPSGQFDDEFKSGQVRFPWVVECTSSGDFNEQDDNDPCYKKEGGWWFGYLAGWEATGEVGPKACIGAPGMPPDGGSKSGVNKVEAKINGEWKNFVGADYLECEGPPITNKEDGSPYIGADGLDIKFTVGAGYLAGYEPSLSGIGVNMGEYPTQAFKKDLDSKGGFCLTYISDHVNTRDREANSGVDFTLVLGWDEGVKGALVKGFDTWWALIPESKGQKKTVDFIWTGAPQTFVEGVDPPKPNEAGMFIQDNYTSWKSNYGKPDYPGPFPIDKATKEMTAVKIALSGYEAAVVEFKLIEFGFAGTCNGGGGSTPIVAGGNRVNPVSFGMIGKVLSLNSSVGKPLAVQVINLQGAVVKTQTMSNGDKMNLQNLPTGIYMVRVPSQGYVAKYAIK